MPTAARISKTLLHKKASYVLTIHSTTFFQSLVMPNSSNAPTVGPDDPEHVWYYDADDDVPMGQSGSSEPARTDNSI